MKRLIWILAICALLLVPSALVIGDSDGYPEDGPRYIHRYSAEWGDYAQLVRYTGDDRSLEIRSEVGGYPVREIDSMAFYECNSLERLVLPETLVSIGENAFVGCESLKSLSVPASVEYIGDYALDLDSLEHLDIECKKLLSSLRVDVKPGCVVSVHSGTDIIGGLKLASGGFEVDVTSAMLDRIHARYLQFSVEPVDKSSLPVDIQRAVGFSDCSAIRMTGLPADSQTHVSVTDFNGNRGVQHAIYRIEGGSLYELENIGSRDVPAFNLEGPGAVISLAVSEKLVPDSPGLGLAVALAGTVLAAVYLLIHRRDLA